MVKSIELLFVRSMEAANYCSCAGLLNLIGEHTDYTRVLFFPGQ